VAPAARSQQATGSQRAEGQQVLQLVTVFDVEFRCVWREGKGTGDGHQQPQRQPPAWPLGGGVQERVKKAHGGRQGVGKGGGKGGGAWVARHLRFCRGGPPCRSAIVGHACVGI